MTNNKLKSTICKKIKIESTEGSSSKNPSITAAKVFNSGRMGAIAASGNKFRTEPTF
ncbi:hypothetical protein [Microcoleus sp. S13_C3]|uniref:hypothetical protein n=1 Tax=Microcoleus sp. S13_C3 TaxID=3055409 RepID=UPI002FD4095F